MLTSKLETYLGFSIKNNSIIFGYDKIIESRKKPHIIVVSPNINDKVKLKLINYATYHSIDIVQTNELLSDIIHRDNCKVVAVLDENLSKAIMNLELKKLQGSN